MHWGWVLSAAPRTDLCPVAPRLLTTVPQILIWTPVFTCTKLTNTKYETAFSFFFWGWGLMIDPEEVRGPTVTRFLSPVMCAHAHIFNWCTARKDDKIWRDDEEYTLHCRAGITHVVVWGMRPAECASSTHFCLYFFVLSHVTFQYTLSAAYTLYRQHCLHTSQAEWYIVYIADQISDWQ